MGARAAAGAAGKAAGRPWGASRGGLPPGRLFAEILLVLWGKMQ